MIKDKKCLTNEIKSYGAENKTNFHDDVLPAKKPLYATCSIKLIDPDFRGDTLLLTQKILKECKFKVKGTNIKRETIKI